MGFIIFVKLRNLFMLRNLFLLILLSSIQIATIAQVFGDPVITEDFANGLPETWGNESITGISQWEFRGPLTEPSNEVCSRGACGAQSVPLQSETLENGFIIFDSNYWDDPSDACGSNIGGGLDPGPHLNTLTTESFDLSSYNSLVLTFQQQYKHFNTIGQETTTTVSVSTDGGENYDLLIDNSLAGLANSPNVEWVSITINDYVGFDDVRFKFTFDGFYYWWLIDDFTLFIPSENDLIIEKANYTTFEENLENDFQDMEFFSYPKLMIPEFSFKAEGTNIGGFDQTGTHLNVRVSNSSSDVYFQENSEFNNLSSGTSFTWSLEGPYFPPSVLDDYSIRFRLNQDQDDETPWNNEIVKNFRITDHQIGLDQGPLEDQFFPSANYQDSPYNIGNVFVPYESGLVMHDILVGVGDSSIVGSEIEGIVYYFLNDSIVYGETETYVINEYDLNAEGEEFMVHLPIIEPFEIKEDTTYLVLVTSQSNEGERFIVGRSGDAEAFAAVVQFEDPIFSGYMLKYPMVRMNLFEPEDIPGCTNLSAFNYDPVADTDDGSCRISGCTKLEATNLSPEANWEDGSCLIEGCADPNADNYNPDANVEIACIYPGCTDPEANNYNEIANEDDGSCIFNNAFFMVNQESGCAPFELVVYNQTEVVENGSCVFTLNGQDSITACPDSIVYQITEPGNYSVNYTYSVGEFESTYSIDNIVVFDVPETPVISYNQETNLLTCTNCDQPNIDWFFEGDLFTTDDPESWEPTENGFYQVTVTNDQNCSASSQELYVLVVGVNELFLKEAKAFPNPSNSVLNISSEYTIMGYSIYNQMGQFIEQKKCNKEQFQINTLALPNGLYHLRLQSGIHTFHATFVVEH